MSRSPACELVQVSDHVLHPAAVRRPAPYGWVRRGSFDKMFDRFAAIRRRSHRMQHLYIEERAVARFSSWGKCRVAAVGGVTYRHIEDAVAARRRRGYGTVGAPRVRRLCAPRHGLLRL